MQANRTMRYTFWTDGGFYLGYLVDYPDYQTQGVSKAELVSNRAKCLTSEKWMIRT